ncbi:MAG: hypothetical protein PVJ89_08155, partial [Planctomycetota bacterium]
MTRTPLLLAAVLATAAAPAPALHDDDPKVLDRRPAYQGPGFRRGATTLAGTAAAGVALPFEAQGMRLESWLPLGELDLANSGNDCWG